MNVKTCQIIAAVARTVPRRTILYFFETRHETCWEGADDNGNQYIRKVSHMDVTILDTKLYDHDSKKDYYRYLPCCQQVLTHY